MILSRLICLLSTGGIPLPVRGVVGKIGVPGVKPLKRDLINKIKELQSGPEVSLLLKSSLSA